MSNKELLESVGEGCSENTKCSECNMQVVCRKDIYENYPELKMESNK